MRVDLHPEALAEFRSATLWYEEQRQGLGDRFVAEVDDTLTRISQTPKLFPVWPGTGQAQVPIRKAPVSHFPYLIAFEPQQRTTLVLAVAHEKRRPLYWLTRGSQN